MRRPRTSIEFSSLPSQTCQTGASRQKARPLDGFDVRFAPATGDKETRAKPVSAQAGELPRGQHDDEVDGLSGAYERLAEPTGATGSADLAELKRNNPHLFPPEWDVARFDATPPLVARRTGVFVPRFTPTRRTW